MKDIAQEIGRISGYGFESPARLSWASEEHARGVLSVAKEMNYGPNLVARALVSGRTYSIGLVIPDLVHPFFAQIARALPLSCMSGATA